MVLAKQNTHVVQTQLLDFQSVIICAKSIMIYPYIKYYAALRMYGVGAKVST